MKTTLSQKIFVLISACMLFAGANAFAQNATAQSTNSKVYELKEVDQRPMEKGMRAFPKYPLELKKAGISATAIIEFVINEQGDTENVKALESSDKSWSAACIEAVKQWKFRAARKNGAAVKCRMQVPFGGTMSKSQVTPSKITLLNPKKVDKEPVAQRLASSIKYPQALEKAKKTGSVTVQYTVTVKGIVEDIKVTKTKHEDFSKAVTDALSTIKFRPATVGGAPVECRVQQTISFDIED